MRQEAKSSFANTLADFISVGMTGCEKYGMAWGCDIDCPVLQSGDCENDETDDLIKEIKESKTNIKIER